MSATVSPTATRTLRGWLYHYRFGFVGAAAGFLVWLLLLAAFTAVSVFTTVPAAAAVSPATVQVSTVLSAEDAEKFAAAVQKIDPDYSVAAASEFSVTFCEQLATHGVSDGVRMLVLGVSHSGANVFDAHAVARTGVTYYCPEFALDVSAAFGQHAL